MDNKKPDQVPDKTESVRMNHLLEQRWKMRDVPVNEKIHYRRLIVRWVIPAVLVITLLYFAIEMGLGSVLVTFLIYITIGYVFLMIIYVLFTGTSVSDSISRSLRRSGLVKYKKK